MIERRDRQVGSVSTVLRGENLRQVVHVAPATPAGGTADGKTLNGVPLSAAKHCCGRACQHCRIYWNKAGG